MLRTFSICGLCLLLAIMVGCGASTEEGGGASSEAQDVTQQPEVAGADAGAAGDAVGAPDVTVTTDTVAAVDAATGADVAQPGNDSGPTDDCPGGPECPCTDNSDCDKGICIETAGGKECARTCVDQCKKGFACTPFAASGGDNVLICAPVWDWVCDPCSASAQCKKVGLEAAVCVDYGDDGGFCGTPCQEDSACPADYVCKQVQTVEGVGAKQCVRKGEPLGACECSEAAKSKQLSTTCAITHKDDKGQVTATCAGVRKCGEKGLSKCIGPAPSAEVCDGADNDCDGEIDEKTCDDNNACTADACDPAAAKDGKDGCKHNKLDGPCDADGSNCTEADKCVGGICVPGQAKNCDDGNTCTLDVCDPAVGCTKTVDDGKSCDGDGNPCTVGDQCKQGVCATGAPKNCDSNDACVLAKCQPATGKCKYTDKSNGSTCDDGSKCTVTDACTGGFCTGKAVGCDDKNPCTTDSCKPSSGCAHTANALPCNDDNKCTFQDLCSGGACAGLPVDVTKLCDDANPCTTPSCLPQKGCAQSDNSELCTDGNICTTGDRCKGGKCEAGTSTCVCESNADCAAKEDGNLCNGTLYCDKTKASFTCKVNPKTVVSCPASSVACKKNVCEAKTGKCKAKSLPDATLCNADDSVCTALDRCVSGTCTKGKPLACNDGKVCTDDSCEPQKGCMFVANAAKCDADGSVCTVGDMCAKGLCLAGQKKLCDDGNACTDDSCDKVKGCRFTANADGCDDNDPCTVGDTCAAKACSGKASKCDDNNPCTADSCKPKSGCVYQPQKSSCEDGNACTVADQCGVAKDGKWGCTAGKAKDCDDGNACTVDGCSAKIGCTKKVVVNTVMACYSGAKGTVGVGLCGKGKAQCKADGTMGPCVGEVVPNNTEQCDGKDDDCDGKTDEGCGTTDWAFTQLSGRIAASGSKYNLDAHSGGRVGGVAASSGGRTLQWGVQAWISSWSGK